MCSFDLLIKSLHAKGWVFESQPRQTLVVKTGSYSPTANNSAICKCHGSSVMTTINGCPVSQCSVAMSAEHRSKLVALQITSP